MAEQRYRPRAVREASKKKVGTNAIGATKPSPPAYVVRAGRSCYALLASAFFACVVVQVFFAGVGIFGADWSFHTYFVALFQLLLPPMFVLAFVGRLPLALKLSPVGLWSLVTVQYALANLDGPAAVAALHPVNALLIFCTSFSIARRSWRSATGQTKG